MRTVARAHARHVWFEALSCCSDCCLSALQAFCPEDLSRLCWSLSYLRYSSPDLNTAALNQLSHQLEVWPLSCIGRLLSALARIQASPDPCTLERVAGHVNVVLRNMRTSTDGQKTLQSLTAKARSEAGSSSNSSSGSSEGSWQGLGSSNYGPVAGGPTWQGFGMMRSSSSSSSSSFSSSDGSTYDSVHFISSSPASANGNGAAAIWEAANSCSSNYEYTDDHPLGPEYTAVTSYGPDGRIVTTYMRHDSAGRDIDRSAVVSVPVASTTSTRAFSSRSSDMSASRGSWYNQARASQDECPIAALKDVPVPDNCR